MGDMILADERQEEFCQGVAKGLNIVDAYVRAGYAKNTGNASSLSKKPHVRERIEHLRRVLTSEIEREIQEQAALYSEDFVVGNLVRLAKGHGSSAVQATLGLAKVKGLITADRENPEKLSDDQLFERLRKQGIEKSVINGLRAVIKN